MSAVPSFPITVVDSCAPAKLALNALYLPYCPKGPMTFALDHLGSPPRHQQSCWTFVQNPILLPSALLSLQSPYLDFLVARRGDSVARDTFPIR